MCIIPEQSAHQDLLRSLESEMSRCDHGGRNIFLRIPPDKRPKQAVDETFSKRDILGHFDDTLQVQSSDESIEYGCSLKLKCLSKTSMIEPFDSNFSFREQPYD
jgi:hypothetical protein